MTGKTRLSKSRFAAILVVLFCMASSTFARDSDWYVEKDTWVGSYMETMNRILSLEREQGITIPEYRNEKQLPAVIHARTCDSLGSVEFDIDVADVQKLYIGASKRVEIRDAKLIDKSGVEHPLVSNEEPPVVYVEKTDKGRVNPTRDRVDIQHESEVGLELNGEFKRLTGTLRSDEQSNVIWMDTESHFDKWEKVSRYRRDFWQRLEGSTRAKYEDSMKSTAARQQIERLRWAMPSFNRPTTPSKAAAIFAETLLDREGRRVDPRIVETVKKAAETVKTTSDFERLTRLSYAIVNYGDFRRARDTATKTIECPGLATAFQKIEDEFFLLDPDKTDYGIALLEKIDVFNEVAEQCKTIGDTIQLARDTIEFVDKVNPVPPGVRQRLDLLEKALDPSKGDLDAFMTARDKIVKLRRDVLFSHPALDFDRILINRNPPTLYSHNGDQHLGRHSREAPGLTILSDWKSGAPKAKTLLEGKLPVGATRNPDLHYDAEKVAFAFCDHSTELAKRPDLRRYFLYEAAIDGSWVRQLTGTRRDTMETWNDRATVMIEDNDPCYLPDGGFVFISTRSQSFGRCHGGRYNPAWVLYRADGNGDHIQQLSFGNENEYEPSVLNDGRIVFTRWEYTNRHEMFFHMLWWCRPDGTNVSHYYGNDTLEPMMVVEASAIAGTHRIVATAQGHHSYNTGTTVILDTNMGENGERPVRHITPETPYSENHGWPSPHFSHPYAITEDLFLVSRANHPVHPQGSTPPPADRAIFLVDSLGGRELIYEDLEVASFSPIPIKKRQRPPALPPLVAEEAPDYGTIFLQNAYLTRNDPEGKIAPGSIKAIRVNALGVQPRANRTACSMTVGVEIPKKVLGTVPVNADGSAHFKIPARTSVQVQILDENGLAILTEKSLFYLQPGESRGCVGCHAPSENSGISAGAPGLASRMAPMDLEPSAGPQYKGGLSFARTVQPVLDRYCLDCHGLEKTEKDVNLVDDGQTYPRPYRALVERGDHQIGLKGYKTEENTISRPFEYFAHGSKIPKMLLAAHGDVKVDRESFMRVIEWLDLNAQCYGDLFPNKIEERRINSKALTELRTYAKELFGEKIAAQPERALINVAQPDESRILMAPLSESAGGWGRIDAWNSKRDAGYRKMAELVEKCIERRPNENTNGWEPTLDCGGGEEWVIKAREDYLQRSLISDATRR